MAVEGVGVRGRMGASGCVLTPPLASSWVTCVLPAAPLAVFRPSLESLSPASSHPLACALVLGLNGDLHVFDPSAMAWEDLSADVSGTAPSPRYSMGFASAGGKLYVFGGYGGAGAYERGVVWEWLVREKEGGRAGGQKGGGFVVCDGAQQQELFGQ